MILEMLFGNRIEDYRKPHVKSNICMTICVEKPLYVNRNRKSTMKWYDMHIVALLLNHMLIAW
jgi:hypothetical protein